MKIKTKIVLAVMAIQCVFSQANTESEQVRSIRLENFINNYKGKTIRFKNENSRFVEGVLMEITDTDFVLSINSSATFHTSQTYGVMSAKPTTKCNIIHSLGTRRHERFQTRLDVVECT